MLDTLRRFFGNNRGGASGRSQFEGNGYFCATCGKYHDELPFAYGVPAPIYWTDDLSGDEKSELAHDTCVIRGEHFFIKGNIEIPIIGSDEIFAYTVWASLSENSFQQAESRWNDPQRTEEEPYFGWLSNQLLGYPDTVNLKTLVHTRQLGIVPFIELEPTDHPLAVEQRNGITMERVAELAQVNLHPERFGYDLRR